MNSSTTKNYSKPELVTLGDAMQFTLGWYGWRRDWYYGRRRRRHHHHHHH